MKRTAIAKAIGLGAFTLPESIMPGMPAMLHCQCQLSPSSNIRMVMPCLLLSLVGYGDAAIDVCAVYVP